MQRKYVRKEFWVGVLLGAVTIIGVSSWIAIAQHNQAPVQNVVKATAPVATPGVSYAGRLPDFADLVDRVGPSVVNIRTKELIKSPQLSGGYGDPFDIFGQLFGIPFGGMPGFGQQLPRDPRNQPREYSSGQGSGFIISKDGYILTNAHVIKGADKITVTLTNKKEYTAKVIGFDEKTDVGLIKVSADNLPTIAMGRSANVRVGEWVIAIGSPFGLENSVTAGIVSAKSRETGEFLPFIQTDVAINPGNSGGPLINMSGQVVGINSQIYSRSGGYMGISFSIPIDEAMKIVDQLKTTGKVQRGKIGIAIDAVDEQLAKSLKLPDGARGVVVGSVEKDSPAEKGGVRIGDIILEVNGKPILKPTELVREISGTKPGATALLKIYRRGKYLNLNLTVDESTSVASNDASAGSSGKMGPTKTDRLGLSVTANREAIARNVSNGVLVTKSSGPAAEAGIRSGFVILRVGDFDIQSVADYQNALEELKGISEIPLLVFDGRSVGYVIVENR